MAMVAMFAFVAAQSANPQVWQRYHEPFVLILMAVMASRVTGDPGETSRLETKLRLIGPLALALLLGSITVMKIVTSPAIGI